MKGNAYFGIISNTAGGYSCYRDARLRRLTRYRYNGVPADSGGRYLYLRDNGSGEYWSPSWQPVRRDLDSYECRHGLLHPDLVRMPRGTGRDPVLRPARRDARGVAAARPQRARRAAYFACSEPLAGFGTQREEFLGAYRGWDRPLVVERGESANSVARGWAPHGSHHVPTAW
ncbi:MAG TPA: hypothetical protein VFW50_35930 [Streptosporangiaceae bacterium]|nr:hypothetical protein [Streptosporangiaceae bacterium]